MKQVTVRGLGYKNLCERVAETCAEEARSGHRLVSTSAGMLGGGFGSLVSRVLTFEEDSSVKIDLPVGPIVVEVARGFTASTRVARLREIEETARAKGCIKWWQLEVSQDGHNIVVLGFEVLPEFFVRAERHEQARRQASKEPRCNEDVQRALDLLLEEDSCRCDQCLTKYAILTARLHDEDDDWEKPSFP